MSNTVHYHDILAAVAVRINALQGTDPAELQITYSQRPLTDEVFQSTIFPMNANRDAILNAEQKLANAISLSADRTLRTFLRSVTEPLATGNALPKFDFEGNPIIGNFGAVLDGADQSIMVTRMPVAVVRNRVLAPDIFLAPAYYFALDGVRLIHTRDTVILECCVYNAETQTSRFDFNETMLLPDSMSEALICGACAMLVRDDEWVQQAQQWAAYFTTTLASLPPATMEQIAA